MSRIFITGDTHGRLDIGKLTDYMFLDGDNLTYSDYVIIAGDICVPSFGKTLETDSTFDFYKSRKYTTLFVDGNHENFGELNSLPVEMWNGGKVHRLAQNMIHLMRGQVYTIGDKKIFTFGGALSIDKDIRTPGYTWFSEEECNVHEINEAIDNLSNHNYIVDYIITHTCGQEYMARNAYKLGIKFNPCYQGSTEKFLDYIEENVKCKHWYFGHYHYDKVIDTKHTLLYNDIIEIY